MIKYFHVRNFKNLADIEADFGRINAIIGPNGCGKSSLLQAIDFLRAFFYPSIESYLEEKGYTYNDLPNLRRTGKAIHWTIRAELGPDIRGKCGGEYEFDISIRKWKYLGIGEERLIYTPPEGKPQTIIERKGRNLKCLLDQQAEQNIAMARMPRSLMVDLDSPRLKARFPEIFHFRDWITSFRSYLLLDPKVLRKPDRGKHLELGSSGEHLAPVLAHLKRSEPKKFIMLVKRLKTLFPTVSDITIKGGRGWGWQGINLVEGNGRRISFNSQQMSDGVLRLLAVCTFLYAQSVPGVLAFEEPENGVHPQLVENVIEILRELTLRKPPHECQVFLTTHSPYVLDNFIKYPEQVHVMQRGKPLEGASLQRLSDKKDLDIAKTLYKHSLGEAWYTGLIGGTAKKGR